MRNLVNRACPPTTPRDEDGQGLVEYALLIVSVALVVFAALVVFGPKVAALYNSANNAIG